MLPCFLSAVVASLAVVAGLALDVLLTGRSLDARRGLSPTLLGFGTWLISIILVANWLQTPGFAGTVQYWTDGAGRISLLFHVRVAAMLLMFPAMLLVVAVPCSISGATVAGGKAVRLRRLILPVMAMAAFGVACSLFFAYEFFPTV
jgi:hypothetical protein